MINTSFIEIVIKLQATEYQINVKAITDQTKFGKPYLQNSC